MVPIVFNLRTQPAREVGGVYVATRAPTAHYFGGPTNDFDLGQDLNEGVDVQPSDIQIAPRQNMTTVRLRDGSERSTEKGPPRVNATVSLSCLTTDDLKAIYRIIRSGRPVALGAWYDTSTMFMSHFGGYGLEGENFAGTGEVGYSLNYTIRRDETGKLGYYEHPIAGAERLYNRMLTYLGTGVVPKIVPGMIGSAVLLESARVNKALTRLNSGTYIFPTLTAGISRIVGNISSLPVGLPHTLRYQYDVTPYPGTVYAETGTQTLTNGVLHYAYIIARGNGTAILEWYEGGVVKATGTGVTLSDVPQKVGVAFTTTSTTGTLRLSGLGLVSVEACQIEVGAAPTSFMDYSTAPSPVRGDAIGMLEGFVWPGFTLQTYVKWRNDADEKYWFIATTAAGATALYAKIVGTDLKVQLGTTEHTLSLGSPVVDAWTHIGLTYEKATAAGGLCTIRAWCNGAQTASINVTATHSPNTFSFWLGNNSTSFSGKSLNMAVDSARLDARVWTAAQMASDYALRTDPGAQAILTFLQGRYFNIVSQIATQSRNTEFWDMALSLEEADVRRQSVF